jgi:hypothetical protein
MTPRLQVPIVCFIFAALFLALVVKVKPMPEWIRMFLALMALVLGTIGLFTLVDWVSYVATERVRAYQIAKSTAIRMVAQAVRELTASQTEAVFALDQTYITLIADEAGPVFLVRTLSRDVPFSAVEEFLQRSADTRPFLYPVREFGNKEWAAAITNLIVARGWAERGVGPMPAKATRDIAWIAARFGVSLEMEGET